MSLGVLFVGVIIGTAAACILSTPQKQVKESHVDVTLSRHGDYIWEVACTDGNYFEIVSDTTSEAIEIARRILSDKGYVNYSFEVYN